MERERWNGTLPTIALPDLEADTQGVPVLQLFRDVRRARAELHRLYCCQFILPIWLNVVARVACPDIELPDYESGHGKRLMTRVKKEREGFAEWPVRSTGIYVSPASDAMYDLFMQMWAVVGKWLVANRLAAVLQFRSRHVLRTSLHQWTYFSMPELLSSSESEHGWRPHPSDGSSDDGSSDDAP